MARIAVAGGGICGLAGAMMLADDGHEVTVFERDPTPPPSGPNDAFDWERRSVAQFGLVHWMQARGTRILRDEVPRAFELLRENGGLPINLIKRFLAVQGAEVEAGDDRFDQLTARRSTIEWALALAADEHPNVDVRRGQVIDGLITAAEDRDVPHVTGLRVADGSAFSADLVLDATGRRSPTPRWFEQIGAVAPIDFSADTSFAYCGRFYRSDTGELPAVKGPIVVTCGTYTLLTLPADNGTWAVTLYGLAEDKPLRRFRDLEVFESVVREMPLHAHWLDGEPLSELKSMVGPVDTHRSFVVDGTPCATGILSIADAVASTNPSVGRGMTIGLIHTEVMRSVVRDHLGDPEALALALHERTKNEVLPLHNATVSADHRRIKEMRIFREGGTPEPSAEERIMDSLLAYASSDPLMARSFGEIMSCATPADVVIARPEVVARATELMASGPVGRPAPAPDRERLLELVASR